MDSLRSGISDVVNTLNKLRNNSTDAAEQERIQKVLRVLFSLWDEVIRQEITITTPEYQNALARLREADASSQAALKDLAKVQAAIEKATQAAKAVDQVVKLFSALGLA